MAFITSHPLTALSKRAGNCSPFHGSRSIRRFSFAEAQSSFMKWSTVRMCVPDDRSRENNSELYQPQQQRQAVISVDIGTSSVKSALYFIDDQCLDQVFKVEHDTFSDASRGIVSQNPKAWYDGTIETIRNALASLPPSKLENLQVRAISITGQMQDVIGVGENVPEVIRSGCILYSDCRATEEATSLSELAGQKILSTSLLAKLKFLKNHLPRSPSEGDDFKLLFGAADYIVYRLCSEEVRVTDATTISTTGLSTGPSHRTYDVDMLERCGLGQFVGKFPAILASTGAVGTLCDEVVKEVGYGDLLRGVDVVHAGGDAFSTTCGTGCATPGAGMYLYAGTTGWIGRTVDTTAGRADEAVMNNRSLFRLGHAGEPGWTIVAASVLNVGSAFRQVCEMFDCKVDEIDVLCAQSTVGSNGVVYVPYVNGRRCPDARDTSRGGFYGISAETRRGDLVRAAVEGVVFSFAEAWEAMGGSSSGSGSGQRTDVVIRVIGGVSRSAVFVEGIGQVVGRVQVRGCEGGLVGAAAVAMGRVTGAGSWRAVDSDAGGRLEWTRGWAVWKTVVHTMERLW